MQSLLHDPAWRDREMRNPQESGRRTLSACIRKGFMNEHGSDREEAFISFLSVNADILIRNSRMQFHLSFLSEPADVPSQRVSRDSELWRSVVAGKDCQILSRQKDAKHSIYIQWAYSLLRICIWYHEISQKEWYQECLGDKWIHVQRMPEKDRKSCRCSKYRYQMIHRRILQRYLLRKITAGLRQCKTMPGTWYSDRDYDIDHPLIQR